MCRNFDLSHDKYEKKGEQTKSSSMKKLVLHINHAQKIKDRHFYPLQFIRSKDKQLFEIYA